MQAHDIFLSAFGETTKTVPEIEIAGILDSLSDGERRHRQASLRGLSRAVRTAMRRKKRHGAVDLVDNLAIPHMQHDTGGRQKRAPGLFVHQVAANGEHMRPTTIGGIDATLRLGNMIQRMLHILCIRRGPFVDDDEIEYHTARTQIFVGAERLTGDIHVHIVVNTQAEDREIARNGKRPKRPLRSKTRFQRFRDPRADACPDRSDNGRDAGKRRPAAK